MGSVFPLVLYRLATLISCFFIFYYYGLWQGKQLHYYHCYVGCQGIKLIIIIAINVIWTIKKCFIGHVLFVYFAKRLSAVPIDSFAILTVYGCCLALYFLQGICDKLAHQNLLLLRYPSGPAQHFHQRIFIDRTSIARISSYSLL